MTGELIVNGIIRLLVLFPLFSVLPKAWSQYVNHINGLKPLRAMVVGIIVTAIIVDLVPMVFLVGAYKGLWCETDLPSILYFNTLEEVIIGVSFYLFFNYKLKD